MLVDPDSAVHVTFGKRAVVTVVVRDVVSVDDTDVDAVVVAVDVAVVFSQLWKSFAKKASIAPLS